MKNIFDIVFNSGWGDMIATDFYQSIPSADITETDKGYQYQIAVPGHKKEDFSVELDNNYIKVSVIKKEETRQEYKRKEFDYSGSSRRFYLSDQADYKSLKASYTNGLLLINVDKKTIVQQNMQIEIK
jgi:HSP20 family protein